MSTWIIIAAVIVAVAAAFSPKTEEQKEHTYNAHFGDENDFLSAYNHGFAITGHKAITEEMSYTNAIIFGPTGTNKSTSAIFCSAVSLSRCLASMIFFDVSGEIFLHCATYLSKKGYLVLRINFADALHSESFNCLSFCTSVSDIQKVATLIIKNANGETKGDIFWEQSSIALISLFARYLVFHADRKYCNLQNVLRLIEKFAVDTSQTIDKMMLRTKDEELISAYKATVAMSDKTLQSVIASVRAAMLLFTDPSVCRTTATNTIDFSLLRGKQPIAIFVCTPLKDLHYFKPLSALFFQTMFNEVMSRIPGKHERSIFFIIDEFATMRFSAISTIVSNIRKYRSGLLLCMQDQNALMQYGAAEAHQIKTNCGVQCFLKSQPIETAKELSQILGRYSYMEGTVQKTRELMTPDEVRMSEEAIILINNQAPLKCKIVPYYENIWLQNTLRARPYDLPEKNITEPPLIPFI